MFDTFHDAGHRLSHDLPCPRCAHARHTYLACSDTCPCSPDTAHLQGVSSTLVARRSSIAR